MSNMPLQQPKAVSSRSTVNEPGPRGPPDERRPPRGPGSATIDLHLRPSLLNGKALDTRDRLARAMEFWRRRKSALDLRCDVVVDDLGYCSGWLAHGDHGGACGCHEHVRLGFGAGIFSRVVDLANTLSGNAATGARTKSAQRSRPLDKRHPGLPKIAAPHGSSLPSKAGVGQARGPDVQHAVAAAEGRQLSVDGQRAGAARLFR
jgi:hypothetical protein